MGPVWWCPFISGRQVSEFVSGQGCRDGSHQNAERFPGCGGRLWLGEISTSLHPSHCFTSWPQTNRLRAGIHDTIYQLIWSYAFTYAHTAGYSTANLQTGRILREWHIHRTSWKKDYPWGSIRMSSRIVGISHFKLEGVLMMLRSTFACLSGR